MLSKILSNFFAVCGYRWTSSKWKNSITIKICVRVTSRQDVWISVAILGHPTTGKIALVSNFCVKAGCVNKCGYLWTSRKWKNSITIKFVSVSRQVVWMSVAIFGHPANGKNSIAIKFVFVSSQVSRLNRDK